MAENSKIEWCHHTFNSWLGCTKVSPACDHCYAEGWAKRTGNASLWAGERRLTSDDYWRQPLKWNAKAAKLGVRYRVFCASLGDIFDNQVPPAWRAGLWALIADTPHLDWLLLTKRPQNIPKMLPSVTCEAMIAGRPWPWPNVWLGTTVENQEEAERRIPHLLEVLAAVHFLSCEPLLDTIDLRPWMRKDREGSTPGARWAIDWVIVGGESGPGARVTWIPSVRKLVNACRNASVPVFVKQLGANIQDRNDAGFDGCDPWEWPEGTDDKAEFNPNGFLEEYQGAPVRIRLKSRKGGDPDEWPEDLRIRQFLDAFKKQQEAA